MNDNSTFHIVGFEDSSLGIIRSAWLTPKEKNTFSPPYKLTKDYERCLVGREALQDSWSLHKISKVFYKTDDVLKAKKKLREAESESDILTCAEDDENHSNKRKRKLKKSLYTSSSSSSDDKNASRPTISFPTPPPATSMPRTVDSIQETPSTSFDTLSTSAALGVIAKHLAKLTTTVDELAKNQRVILDSLSPQQAASFDFANSDVKLPCASAEEVCHLNLWILESEEHERQLVRKSSYSTTILLLNFW
ncbi:hypothetical protein FQA39_LY07939 [Lamprigera yunnana]|nr:hypothetical protein FQA39_LY07939 [Lamprigera yunnana]